MSLKSCNDVFIPKEKMTDIVQYINANINRFIEN